MVVANFSVPKVQRPEINVSASQIESQDFDVNIKVVEHNELLGRDKENCHPIKSITGLEENLENLSEVDEDLQEQINDISTVVKGFVFEQAVVSDTWDIVHNLNKRPSVTVVDSAGTVFYPKVEYIDDNECIISMNYPMLGFAYLN